MSVSRFIAPKKLVDSSWDHLYTPKNLGDKRRIYGASEDRKPDPAGTRDHARPLGNRPRKRTDRTAKTQTRSRLHHRSDHAQYPRTEREGEADTEEPRLFLQTCRESQTGRRQTRHRRGRSSVRWFG